MSIQQRLMLAGATTLDGAAEIVGEENEIAGGNALQKEFSYFNHRCGHLSCQVCQVVFPVIYCVSP